MKINTKIPNYLKLPHLGHQWKFLKNKEQTTCTNSSMEQSCKPINSSLIQNSNICPIRTQYEVTPQNIKRRLIKSQSIDVNQQLDQIDSVKESNSGQIKKIAQHLIQQFNSNMKATEKYQNPLILQKHLSLNNESVIAIQKPYFEKSKSLYQLQNETKQNSTHQETNEINSFTQFLQLIQIKGKEKGKKRKCQINFFKKSQSMDNVDVVENQKTITKLLLQSKIRIKPKFSPTINIQDLLQQN
ncbi:unnamed protein product (macronuclear) [Paramecium tetraurelia]|uniref:Uncharacterized protein n=1 Tax=Paramecium tetraurelia TaxID=5888 RepID=A0E5R2_PARTE|nr:uncharacterized protein GSPATT00003491001 [Paramecium tetraurelia]CAK90629.1 unnamed protein product [Paramecium tetraurelia]|eukprot:XP_001458026.1 hypothetical protein (macronuclear) [Paramecium tetraurelia strain d4-2]